ncbi:MAG TPA: porphobilinogen synthase [Rhabdaerophilum sp.]|nr:porphobilinogen synthase [Rhabdaerophilum sp.]
MRHSAHDPLDLVRRPRRNRKTEWARRLVRENRVTIDDLIWPIFINEGKVAREPVSTMPGVERVSVEEAVNVAREAKELGIPALCLFPNTPPSLRDEMGSEALNPDNLTCRALRAIKAAVPDIGLITDVALDPYTSHGHDGILENGRILNDETVAILTQQAVIQAGAGADVIAPSDMMDGRVGAIRDALDANGFTDVQIMAYSAKYASAYYGPFRDAVGSSGTLSGDKKTYQMDFANGTEALMEAELDVSEGADMVMVKPGLPYLDIVHRVKSTLGVPTFVYQVSGEYAMIMAAAAQGMIDPEKAMVETLTAFKRAGADGILTYFAPRMARWLKAQN